jgi:hypothetical protein
MSPLEIVAIARETIGTPYAHQGRVAGLALDCAGVPVTSQSVLACPSRTSQTTAVCRNLTR